MNQKLYKSLVEGIGIAIYKSLNEMARLAVQRTIDKKLWLSVASTCSRNKITNAEFIKPGKGDKDNLLQRYVAALIIMRKRCPQDENDIDSIKTFKLVGHKYLELGGTIEEIQDLYNKNTGKSSSNTTTNKPVGKPVNTEDKTVSNKGFDNSISQKSSGGLFDDDDIFGEDNDDYMDSEISQKIVGLMKDTSLQSVLMQEVGIEKPRGFKFIKHTEDEYDKFVFTPTGIYRNPNYTWKYPKYLNDIINIINSKNWKLYSVDAPSYFNYFRFENMSEAEVKDQIKMACISKYSNLVNNSKDLNDVVNRYFSEYKDFINGRKRQINNIDNQYVKKLFSDDENIYRVYLSPDEGLMLMCKRPEPKHVSGGLSTLPRDYFTNYTEYNWILTFTGNVTNYDTRDKGNDKALKEQIKLYNSRKKIYRQLLDKKCGLSSYKWTMFKSDDNYPIMVTICSKGQCKLTYDNFTKKYYNQYRRTSNYLYVPSDEKTFPNSFKEAVQNNEHWGTSWIKLVCCNNDGKYGHSKYGGSDDEAYMIIMPTETGKAAIDSRL